MKIATIRIATIPKPGEQKQDVGIIKTKVWRGCQVELELEPLGKRHNLTISDIS